MMSDFSAGIASPPAKGNTPSPLARRVSVIGKVVIIIVITMVLLIPLAMVSGIIAEREGNRISVQNEISRTWAGEQTVVGPILTVPYTTYEEVQDKKGNKKVKAVLEHAYLLPEAYDVKSTLAPEVRNRGLFQATVYQSTSHINGKFNVSTLNTLKIDPRDIHWNQAFVVMGIPNTKGISKKPSIQWHGKTHELLPGMNGSRILKSGLFTPVSIDPKGGKSIPFQMDLVLNGSENFFLLPIGKDNTFTIDSPWPSPSFIGNTLPDKKDITENGFRATWNIPYFSRSYGQVLKQDEINHIEWGNSLLLEPRVGVNLLSTVDPYRQSERAAKYGILFIILTFATYFIFEMMSKVRLHPFQYFLVGCSLCLFYLLLTALAEIIGFAWAYGLASFATILSISLYSLAILKVKKAAIMAILLTILYSYLYVLLQLEAFSLVFGAMGLFVVLSLCMYVTRNIDWYNEQAEQPA